MDKLTCQLNRLRVVKKSQKGICFIHKWSEIKMDTTILFTDPELLFIFKCF